MPEKKTLYAALDIGTSQLKLAVYCASLSGSVMLINSYPNEVIYGSSGAASGDYELVSKQSFSLFKDLGEFIKANKIEVLYLGICGHISSLIEWNKTNDGTAEKLFPTWLDTTCYNSLAEYNTLMGDGRSREIIGTFLPAGTNWLLTKLLQKKKEGFANRSMFLQVSDVIFHQLTGLYQTHFSSQLSMVDLRTKMYAPALLDHLGLNEASLPAINYDCVPVLDGMKQSFNFPKDSFVFPAMADLYASLYGLRLEDKEGFMLANTSEQAGAFYIQKPNPAPNFLSIHFDPGYINYGSTNTGGNVLHWLLNTVLNKEITPVLLNELTVKAASLAPGDTPLILPYLQGERAPLWNPRLTASVLELNSSHTEVHLFRAVLESIAFARRQCFEQLGIEALHRIKIAGGSSKNTLWNSIRATVLNKPVAVADQKELAMAGLMYYMMQAMNEQGKPAINFSVIHPEPGLKESYDEKYKRFIHYQQLLS